MTVTGQLTLKKEVKSSKFGLILPAQVELFAFIDAQHRIYVQHPVHNSVSMLVKESNISAVTWDNGLDMLSKPKFYQSTLKPVKGDVIAHLFPKQTGVTLEEKLPNNGNCKDCGKNEWMILPKECASVRDGGKPYIECLHCGNVTHL